MNQIADATVHSPSFIAARNRLSGILRVMLYLLCIVCALVLLTLARPHTEDGLIHQVGKNCALVGFAIVALQAVLAARFKWIERPFGMDMVIRFHKAAAILALVFLSLHPMLVAWGNHHGWLLYQLDIRWPVWLGRLALLALAVNIVTSLARRKLRIKFERWRALHNVLGIGIACFGFVHSYRIGGDLTSPTMSASGIPVCWSSEKSGFSVG